jgi:DNA-binding SARP family transcriptional activator
MLGRFAVRTSDLSVIELSSRGASLLAYLAYFSKQDHPRDLLIEALWPDTSYDAGKRGLSQALHDLIGALIVGASGNPASPRGANLMPILTSRTTVQINTDIVDTDVGAYLELVRDTDELTDQTQRLKTRLEIVDKYRGELLPGHSSAWTLRERDLLSSIQLRLLKSIECIFEDKNQRERALEYAIRAVNFAPSNEDAHQRVMRLYALCGRKAEAIRQYQKLAHALWQDGGVKPSRVSCELLQLIRDDDIKDLEFPRMVVTD